MSTELFLSILSENFFSVLSRSELTSYFTKIWERLNKHILFLQKHHILLRQEVKDIFGTLLILENHKEESPVSMLLNFLCVWVMPGNDTW